MIRRRTVGYRALLALTTLSWVAPALAQAPQASPVAQDKAAAPAKNAADPGARPDKGGKGEKPAPKDEEKPGKSEASQAKTDNKPGDNTVGAVDRKEPDDPKLKDRLQRRRRQQDTERAKIAGALRGQPLTEAMQQELKRHARRLARLERIKALAVEAKDTTVVERVNKLIDKENARHDKFVTHVDDKDDKGKDDKGKDDKGGAEMRALLLAIALSALAGTAGCEKEKSSESASSTASATAVLATAASTAAPAPAASATTTTAAAGAGSPAENIPVAADFEEDAEKSITKANYRAELDSLEAEIK